MASNSKVQTAVYTFFIVRRCCPQRRHVYHDVGTFPAAISSTATQMTIVLDEMAQGMNEEFTFEEKVAIIQILSFSSICFI
jgi:hypothetical protein